MSEKQCNDPIYELDGKISVSKAIPFGLQHILAMFVANIAPILIVAGAERAVGIPAGGSFGRLYPDDVRLYRSQRRADDCQLRLQHQ